MKLAIVGAGISGLGCALQLSKVPGIEITLYEGGDHIGGHSNTVDLTLSTNQETLTHGVDTGFLVFNRKTYPRLLKLFAELDVPITESEMSFSVSTEIKAHQYLEWAGTNLNTLFAQRANLIRPSFLRMVSDILRFNKLSTRLANSGQADELSESVEEFLLKNRFSKEFRNWYFLPMIGAIWSCSVKQMLDFPIASMIRFCHNHGLLQVNDRPQWLTVKGGSREYVNRAVTQLKSRGVHIVNQAVQSISRNDGKVQLVVNEISHQFDQVVLATHTDQALKLLSDPTINELRLLQSIAYQKNTAILHTDEKLLPKNKQCWAAWNYSTTRSNNDQFVSVSYLINKLQPLPKIWDKKPIIVSLNPLREPDPSHVHRVIEYHHPIFDSSAMTAQKNLPLIQGMNHTWFCGAWSGYGFHEDGLRSGQLVAQSIQEQTRHLLASSAETV